VENRSTAESEVAGSSLEHLEGSAVDDAVLQSLLSAREARARIQLIRLLEARSATNAVAELLNQAADADQGLQSRACEGRRRESDMPRRCEY
jgi:hypothetical protein